MRISSGRFVAVCDANDILRQSKIESAMRNGLNCHEVYLSLSGECFGLQGITRYNLKQMAAALYTEYRAAQQKMREAVTAMKRYRTLARQGMATREPPCENCL